MHLKFPLTYKIAYIKRYIFEKVRCSISRLIQLTIVAYQKNYFGKSDGLIRKYNNYIV